MGNQEVIMRDLFPLGVAEGSAFCNRVQETNLLVENIKNGKHTLLIATRRYGKSSLALHALKISQLPYAEVDFYMATSEKVVEDYILNGVVDLIGKSLGSLDKLLVSIKKYVKNLKPKIDISASLFKLELTSEVNSDPATNVKESLMLLEKLLAEKQQHAVLLFDEFQMVGVIARGAGIEAAIRHVAQKTKFLTIIFSGSNRKLLQTMFEDEARPLYKLCWKMSLDKITALHYQKHLDHVAKLTWKKELPHAVFDKIIFYTDRHPFYMNKLCDRVWAYCKKIPTVTDVDQAWSDILNEDKSDAIKEISLLSLTQKNALQKIATDPSAQLTSKNTLMELQMTSSSVISALDGLEEKDVIEKNSGSYYIINPVVKAYALKRKIS